MIGLRQGFGIGDGRVDLHHVGPDRMHALDDVHLVAVLGGIAAERRVGHEADRVHNQRVAVPMADRVAVIGRIGILGMAAAVGEDLPPLLVSLGDDRDLAGREQEFIRVRLAHDSGHAGRHAVRRGRILDLAGLLSGPIGVEFCLIGRRQRRGLRSSGRNRAAEGRLPETAPGDRLPSPARQRGVGLEGRVVGEGRADTTGQQHRRQGCAQGNIKFHSVPRVSVCAAMCWADSKSLGRAPSRRQTNADRILPITRWILPNPSAR